LLKRWYDPIPTVSMAVSLLQNTSMPCREKIVVYMTDRIHTDFPMETTRFKAESQGLLWIFQKRKALDEASWGLVELLRHLSDKDRDEVALEIIHLIYCIENEEFIHRYDKASA